MENLSFLNEYKRKSLVIGKSITYSYMNNGIREYENGLAIDIDDNGGLIVKKSDGSSIILNSGEISVRI